MAKGGDTPLSEGAQLAPGNGGQYRLMLVDDEEALRKAVSEYLQQASPCFTKVAR